MKAAPAPLSHSWAEDVLAMIIGTLLVSFGLAMFKATGLLTGSTVGLAFLIHYATQWSFGGLFFLINIPFYYLAVKRMGWPFTAKTCVAVGLVSMFTEAHANLAFMAAGNPYYVAVMGGSMMGVGLLVLFRHQTSLGGINILALYLQDSRGWRAGHLQMAFDVCIVLMSLLIVPTQATLASILGVVTMNLIIALNHRPGRYVCL